MHGLSTKQKLQGHERVERATRVLELSIEGYTIPEIAQQLGISRPTAYNDLVSSIARSHDGNRRTAHLFTAKAVQELEHIKRLLKPDIEKRSLTAIDRYIKLVDAQAKLLGAYPQPAQVEKDNGVSVTINYNGLHVDMRQQTVSVQPPTLPDSSAAMPHAGDSSLADDDVVPAVHVLDVIEDAETIAAAPARGIGGNVEA